MINKTIQPLGQWGRSLWAFSRPHTIVGTTLSVLALATLAVTLKSITLSLAELLGWILAALIPSLCANVYIVGLNQLEDIEIDQINKPSLPLASGAFSVKEGQWIVATSGLMALLLAIFQGRYLFLTVAISMLIGTAYSLPPIRLKRFPFWAAVSIFGVRGVVVNVGFFLHFCALFQVSRSIPLDIWVLTAFVILFAFAIAIFKDIPDVEGDRRFQIRTFSIAFGRQRVFNLARWVLTLCYGLMIVLTLMGKLSVSPLFLILTHVGLLMLLWGMSVRIDFNRKKSISQFYQFIWKLFFAEYLLFPIACLLR